MSYAIGNVIYGIPWTKYLQDAWNEVEKTDPDLYFQYDERLGFEQLYSGSAMIMPGYLGVNLAEFSECGDFPLSKITKQPTEEQKQKVQAMVDALPECIKEHLDPIDVYIVWSSS